MRVRVMKASQFSGHSDGWPQLGNFALRKRLIRLLPIQLIIRIIECVFQQLDSYLFVLSLLQP